MTWKISADELTLNPDALDDKTINKALEKGMVQVATKLQRQYSRGKKPDGSDQKRVGQNTRNAAGRPHPRQGKSSQLSDTGELRKSMQSEGKNRQGRIFFTRGTRSKSNSEIAADLNRRGFKNTYLDNKSKDLVTKVFTEEAFTAMVEKLVTMKRRR